MRTISVICLLLFCHVSCTNGNAEQLSPNKYIEWVEDGQNGLLLNKEVGDFRYSLQYKPHEYLAIRELKKMKFHEEELKEKVVNMSDLQYFTFSMGRVDNSDILKSNIEEPADYSKNIEYLSFGIQEQLKLVENKDTLPCILHHFERSYGISPMAKIVLAFPYRAEGGCDKTLIYDDQHFGAGIIKMTIGKEDLNKIPKIKTK